MYLSIYLFMSNTTHAYTTYFKTVEVTCYISSNLNPHIYYLQLGNQQFENFFLSLDLLFVHLLGKAHIICYNNKNINHTKVLYFIFLFFNICRCIGSC